MGGGDGGVSVGGGDGVLMRVEVMVVSVWVEVMVVSVWLLLVASVGVMVGESDGVQVQRVGDCIAHLILIIRQLELRTYIP